MGIKTMPTVLYMSLGGVRVTLAGPGLSMGLRGTGSRPGCNHHEADATALFGTRLRDFVIYSFQVCSREKRNIHAWFILSRFSVLPVLPLSWRSHGPLSLIESERTPSPPRLAWVIPDRGEVLQPNLLDETCHDW
jgi:hypothetical protein